jgi:hypothetical protein
MPVVTWRDGRTIQFEETNMQTTIVHLLTETKPEMRTTRIDVVPTPKTAHKDHGYIHSSDDVRAYRMEQAVKALSAYIRRNEASILAGRLAELTDTLQKMREDEAALSKRRREAQSE